MNYYAEAIEILTTKNEASNLILAEIAKINPSAVVRGYKSLISKDWAKKAKIALRTEGKIPAIKLCRQLTGKSLKEAKEMVEAL